MEVTFQLFEMFFISNKKFPSFDKPPISVMTPSFDATGRILEDSLLYEKSITYPSPFRWLYFIQRSASTN